MGKRKKAGGSRHNGEERGKGNRKGGKPERVTTLAFCKPAPAARPHAALRASFECRLCACWALRVRGLVFRLYGSGFGVKGFGFGFYGLVSGVGVRGPGYGGRGPVSLGLGLGQ